jgi:hypothetical protein
MKGPQTAILLLSCYLSYSCYAQGLPGKATAIANFPSRLFHRIQSKTATLDEQLTRQTEKYLQNMARQEERLRKKLYKVDSNAAKNLFAGSAGRYAALGQRLAQDTGSSSLALSGEYQAYTDSLQGMLKFMKENPQAAASLKQLQSLGSKVQDAEEVTQYIRERKQQLSQYIQQHMSVSGLLRKDYQGFNRGIYYYSQQVREYKEMLNDPDKLTKEALEGRRLYRLTWRRPSHNWTAIRISSANWAPAVGTSTCRILSPIIKKQRVFGAGSNMG